MIETVSMIGAGNVAYHLASALKRKGIRIIDIWSRTQQSGQALARRTGARFKAEAASIDNSSDLVIISVPDRVIREVISTLGNSFTNNLLVHTSGSVSMDVLSDVTGRPGVLYPLQTFRKEKRVPFRTIPVCVEALEERDERALMDLAGRITDTAVLLDSEQRKVLHLGAVIAGNFSNFMYSVAQDILKEKNIPFDLVEPLVLKTAENAGAANAFSLQTGPAIREDHDVMRKHLHLLEGHPAYREMYELISKMIIQYKYEHDKL